MRQELSEWMKKPEYIRLLKGKLDHPETILGSHISKDGEQKIFVYRPNAQQIYLVNKRSDCQEEMDCLSAEDGFFGTYKESICYEEYYFRIKYNDNNIVDVEDSYQYPSQIGELDEYLFAEGTHYQLFNRLGAHLMTINGVRGTYFAVWSPHARAVGVAGSFNMWDGRLHYMRRSKNSNIFELFIPNVGIESIYKYQITTGDGIVLYKSDPFANCGELRPRNASVVVDINYYKWNDVEWMEQQKEKSRIHRLREPMAIYEMHIGSWKKKFDDLEDGFFTYRELAPMIAEYVLEMGYTHIEVIGIAEHPFDGSWGYQVTGYYAPTRRYGMPEDFMYFVDFLHQKGIGVLLDWVPAHFPKDKFGLALFDGEPLYEHSDPRRGEHPHWGTLIFDYGKREVTNFLIASAIFWVEKYHIDGLRVDAVASMLYLDYGKEDGQWLPNHFGGKENLEVMSLLKHLNQIMEEKYVGVVIIAEESTAWKGVTAPVKEGGLGFLFKWNMGWMNDFLEYMKLDPYFRKYHHNKLIFSIMYTYDENFILPFSHDEVVHKKGSMIQKMPGTEAEKFANLRIAYAFMYGHPGKKLLFMGQEFAQQNEWNVKRGLDWGLLKEERHKKMREFVKRLNQIYREYSALYYNDSKENGFEWMSCEDNMRSIIAFVRRGTIEEPQLLFVCNFTPVEYENYCVKVPCKGSYKVILNSDSFEYGGTGKKIMNVVEAKQQNLEKEEWVIQFSLVSLSVIIFQYDFVEKER